MRRDKDGNLRELHVDAAMRVSVLDKYETLPRDEKNPYLIGKCRYFETNKYKLNFTKKSFTVDQKSFLCLTCVKGEGSIEGRPFALGDTYFCPAGAGEVWVDGDMELITVGLPAD